MIRRLGLLAVLCALTVAPVSNAIAAGGYFGFSAGTAEDDILEESATGFKLAVGALMDNNVGIEVAYVDLGTITISSFDFSQSGLAASVMPMLKLNEQASLFAKLGLFAWTFEVDTNGFGSGEDTGADLFFGFGFEYKFSSKAALVAEYESYEVSDGDVSLLSAGVRIGF